MKLPDIKNKYCTRCGEVLSCDWHNAWFDQETGEKTGNLIWKCPNAWFPFSGHDTFLSNKDGSTYSYEI